MHCPPCRPAARSGDYARGWVRGHDEDRTRCDVQQAVGDASEEKPADGARTARPHHDQIGAGAPGDVGDRVRRAGAHVSLDLQRCLDALPGELGSQLLEVLLDLALVGPMRDPDRSYPLDPLDDVHDP